MFDDFTTYLVACFLPATALPSGLILGRHSWGYSGRISFVSCFRGYDIRMEAIVIVIAVATRLLYATTTGQEERHQLN